MIMETLDRKFVLLREYSKLFEFAKISDREVQNVVQFPLDLGSFISL
jgi:hypothetical protein